MYLTLSGSGYIKQNINLYLVLLVPLFIIYAYFIRQIFHHEQELPHFIWFVIFAGIYRVIFFFSDPLMPVIALYPSGPESGFITANSLNLSSPITLFYAYLNQFLGGSILIWRSILLAIEMVLVLFLLKMIRYFSISKYRLLLVILNPLWIIEIYRNGHLEIIGVLLLWLAIYLFYLKKDWLSLSLGIPAFLVHLLPVLAILPFCYNKFRWKFLMLGAGIIAVIFLFSLIKSGFLPGLFVQMNQEFSNGAVYTVIAALLDSMRFPVHQFIVMNWNGTVETITTDAMFYYILIIILPMLIVLTAQRKKLKMTAGFRSINYLQGSFIIAGACLIVKPDLYPWHLIWILPYLIFLPNWSWLALTFLIQLCYTVLLHDPYTGSTALTNWILFVQYLPFFTLMIFEYLDNRRIKGWF